MASASAGDGGAGGEEAAVGPVPAAAVAVAALGRVRSRWGSDIKVYTRKYPRKTPKPPPPPEPTNLSTLSETLSSIRRSVRHPEPGVPAASTSTPSPPPVSVAVVSPSPASSPPAAAALVSSPPPSPIQETSISPPPPVSAQVAATSPPHPAPDPTPPGEPTPPSNDISSGLVPSGHPNGHGNDLALVTAEKAEKAWKRRARSELRRQLASELDLVRVLSKRLKVAADFLAQEASVTMPLTMVAPQTHVADAGYMRTQFSPTGPVTPMPAQAVAVVPARSHLQRGPLTVSVVRTEPFEKEKRTPRANPLYQSSEFLLAKDKFPPESHLQGPKKSKHHKKKHRHGPDFDADRRLYSHAFKKSSALLSRLMKHRFSWVFNKPVDPRALGLHDYFLVIKHPMDLGTIRGRLSHGQYRNPKEFAADVRLTFHNAMTYNDKGQDVHVMAEQLLAIFEAQWPEIEAEVDYLASCPPLPKEFPPPPIDLRFLERSVSVIKHNMALDSNSRPISHTPNYNARTPSSRKPRAKDPNKRDMTIEEKRKLSENLQNLPPEKLNAVVQIIENKNLSVRQHEDEIEVEIDTMDAETLWELDRFVANYKKYMSKQKRKAERAMLARQNAELRAQHPVQQPQTTQELNIGGKSLLQNLMVAEQLVSSMPNQNGTSGQNASSSSSSSSSSSDSGSSSSDSDSDSSSSDGSGGANPS
ncbi:hypothetical protein QOZ80_5AG0363990 [Eleusine coracana subsp. coracana]|nr:hypothetical protein QOZ80_5AG0363990 [Eleusine coracana subsp. coracana]